MSNTQPPPRRLYKIIAREQWQAALAAGLFTGAAIDLADGFIHLSAAHQVEETARRHFAGKQDLLLVAFAEEDIAANLKWETSRGGDLFPHVYGPLLPALALWALPLPWNGAAHEFPEGWNA